MAITTQDMLWRDYTASQLLGAIITKTSGGWVVGRHLRKGWLYVGTDALVFIADEPLQPTVNPRNADRVTYMPYGDLNGVKNLTAPRVAPNGLIEFGNDLMLQGARKQIRALADIVERWGRQSPSKLLEVHIEVAAPCEAPTATPIAANCGRPRPKNRRTK